MRVRLVVRGAGGVRRRRRVPGDVLEEHERIVLGGVEPRGVNGAGAGRAVQPFLIAHPADGRRRGRHLRHQVRGRLGAVAGRRIAVGREGRVGELVGPGLHPDVVRLAGDGVGQRIGERRGVRVLREEPVDVGRVAAAVDRVRRLVLHRDDEDVLDLTARRRRGHGGRAAGPAGRRRRRADRPSGAGGVRRAAGPAGRRRRRVVRRAGAGRAGGGVVVTGGVVVVGGGVVCRRRRRGRRRRGRARAAAFRPAPAVGAPPVPGAPACDDGAPSRKLPLSDEVGVVGLPGGPARGGCACSSCRPSRPAPARVDRGVRAAVELRSAGAGARRCSPSSETRRAGAARPGEERGHCCASISRVTCPEVRNDDRTSDVSAERAPQAQTRAAAQTRARVRSHVQRRAQNRSPSLAI